MSQKYLMTGVLTRISEIKEVSPKFKVRNFILNSGNEEHPNPVKFQLSGKCIDYADDRMIGRKVEVDFYINGNVSKKGYFNNLSAVSIMYTRTEASTP